MCAHTQKKGDAAYTRKQANKLKASGKKGNREQKTGSRGRSKTEIDDTENKLECNSVSMYFVGSSCEEHWQNQTNALIFNKSIQFLRLS